jgi:threonine/homoserine/homoserine lactone efflux protein
MFTEFIPFAVFLFFWNISPGPIVTLISRNSVKYSFKGGFPIILGVMACDAIYLTLAFLGVSEFIASNKTIFEYAKIIGGCYIFYVGITILLESKKNKDYTSANNMPIVYSFKAEFIKGFLTNLSNPFSIVGMTSFILPFFKPEMTLHSKMLFAFIVPFSTLYTFSLVTFVFGNSIIRNIILPKIKWFEILAGIVICYMSVMIVFF